jgi:ribosomal protein S18 acetylase RimI-like enzyme
MFADFQTQIQSKTLPQDLVLRKALLCDLKSIAALLSQRQPQSLRQSERQAQHFLDTGHCLVACLEQQLLGYGRCLQFQQPQDAPANCVPSGWYLMGMIVHPEFQRQNIGRALTEARLEWLRQHCNSVYYFANSLNKASIRLHAQLGFVQVAEHIAFPGVNFSRGGHGLLFYRSLSP